MIGWPLYESQHVARGAFYTVGLIVLKLGLVRRLSWSREMQLVPRAYLERKALLYRLVLESRRLHTMHHDEVCRFQRETLGLIANYVRCHREDINGLEIFVNLLVCDGDEVVVVARSDNHRQPGARYQKDRSLVGTALERGEIAYTGNLEREWRVHGRPYKSVLVIPVRSESAILGAVSIDSTREYHFDIEHRELERALAPYIGLLVWTLESRRNSEQ